VKLSTKAWIAELILAALAVALVIAGIFALLQAVAS